MSHSKYRFRLVLMAMLLGLASLSPGLSAAQTGDTWSTWLYNLDTGRLLHIAQSGEVLQSLDFQPDGFMYGRPVFSTQGDRFAVCWSDPEGNAIFNVYDAGTNEVLVNYYFGAAVGCDVGFGTFNADGSQVAVGVLYHFPDPDDPAPDWEVIVLEVGTSNVLARLNSRQHAVTSLERDFGGVLPLPRLFEDDTIALGMQYMSGGGGLRGDSLIWNWRSGRTSLGVWQGQASVDVLPATQEVIWIDENRAFPQAEADVMTPYNVVTLLSPEGEPYPVFNLGPVALCRSVFINGGQAIAVCIQGAERPVYWVSVNRAGVANALPEDVNSYYLSGTMDGYIYLAKRGGETRLRYRRAGAEDQPGETDTVWRSEGSEGFWVIVWTTPMSGLEDLPPFPAIAPHVAAPASSPRL
ncbi:MAG: hypothetical protein GXY36_18720 [Chloroflexi bacterium]|nr:hypothetical protein [Chloroflexota bacterium]